jgi:predicted dehydrogenase
MTGGGAPLRVGVLGAGVIATAAYGVLPNMAHIAGKATVTAIADTVPGRARAVAGRFGIPQAFGSLSDMLADADIDELTGILGPARRVAAFSGITQRHRTAVGGPFDGQVIDVTADDNTVMMLDFGGNCFGLADGTFNMHATRAPRLEVFGREGTLVMHYNTNETGPHPPLELYRAATPGPAGRPGGWTPLELSHLDERQRHVDQVRRALLIEHLADCLHFERGNELGLDRARHSLEIMLKAMESARTGEAVDLETTFAFGPA